MYQKSRHVVPQVLVRLFVYWLPVCFSGVSFSFLVPGEHNMNYLCTVAFWRRKFCAFDSVNVVSATELVMLVTFIFFFDARRGRRSRRSVSPGLWFARHVGLLDHVEGETRIFQAISKTPEALLWTIRGALVSEGARPAYQNPCLFIIHSDMLTGRSLFNNHSGVYMYNNNTRWVRDP